MARSMWALGLALMPALVLGQAAMQESRAAQDPTCDQRQRVIGHLADKYKEATVAVGVTNSGGLVEVLSSGDGQTWTIIVSSPTGVTCLLATGEGWRALHGIAMTLDPEA